MHVAGLTVYTDNTSPATQQPAPLLPPLMMDHITNPPPVSCSPAGPGGGDEGGDVVPRTAPVKMIRSR